MEQMDYDTKEQVTVNLPPLDLGKELSDQKVEAELQHPAASLQGKCQEKLKNCV